MVKRSDVAGMSNGERAIADGQGSYLLASPTSIKGQRPNDGRSPDERSSATARQAAPHIRRQSRHETGLTKGLDEISSASKGLDEISRLTSGGKAVMKQALQKDSMKLAAPQKDSMELAAPHIRRQSRNETGLTKGLDEIRRLTSGGKAVMKQALQKDLMKLDAPHIRRQSRNETGLTKGLVEIRRASHPAAQP
jgi:hypothetical protein